MTEVKLGFGVEKSKVKTWETSNICPTVGTKFCCVVDANNGLESSWI